MVLYYYEPWIGELAGSGLFLAQRGHSPSCRISTFSRISFNVTSPGHRHQATTQTGDLVFAASQAHHHAGWLLPISVWQSYTWTPHALVSMYHKKVRLKNMNSTILDPELLLCASAASPLWICTCCCLQINRTYKALDLNLSFKEI